MVQLCPPLPPSYLATPLLSCYLMHDLKCSSGACSRPFSMAGHKSDVLPASTAPTYGATALISVHLV
ncbi:hypothetical protein M405DRAFT_814827, partial [Rhizopogon salebrosus TDB-379]